MRLNESELDGFNGYIGNCIGFNGNYNGVYWYSIGGMLNPIGKMPKTHYKMVLLEKANGL